MALNGVSSGDHLTRAGAYIDTGASFTILGWSQQVTLQGDTTFTTHRMFGDPAFTDPYLWLGTYTDGTDTQLYAEAFDGVDYFDSANDVITPGAWYGTAIVVDQPHGEIRLYLIATPGNTPTLIGTIAQDLSGYTFIETTETAYGDPAANQPVGRAYDRVFAGALTPSQIRTELNSPIAILTALSDTPLLDPTDLADISGNSHTWTAVGTPAYLTGPLPPANLTAATATVIPSALPFSATLNVTDAPENPALFFHSVWYTWTCPALTTFIYLTGTLGMDSDASYDPATIVWVGTVDALTILEASDSTQYEAGLATGPTYFRIPVTPGTQYWFQFATSSDGSGAQILDVEMPLPPTAIGPTGSFVITDDTDDFPAAVISPAGVFLRFQAFPAGEFTATMPNGLYCTQDGTADLGVAILDRTGARIATRTFSGEPVSGIFSDNTSYFYVYTGGSAKKLYTLNRLTGAIVRTTLLGQALRNGAPSPDGTRFYVGYGAGTGTVTIDVWDLVNNVLLTTWSVSVGAGFGFFQTSKPGWTTSDGRIFFAFTNNTLTKVLKLNQANGAVLTTYNSALGNVSRLTRCCPINDTYFGIWGLNITPDDDPSYFQYVKISDGTLFSETAGIHITNNSVQSEFPDEPNCISNSCPVFVLTQPLGITPPPGPGTTRAIRRVRQFLLPSSDSNHAMFMPELEVLLQPGIGDGHPTSQGYDPQVMLQVSKDGGKTYGPEQWASAGKQGESTQRVRYRRTPNRYRNGVIRIVVTDPNDWTLVDVVAPKVTEGSS